MSTTWIQTNRKLDERNPLIYTAGPGFTYEVDNKWLNDPTKAGYRPTEIDEPAKADIRKIRPVPKPKKIETSDADSGADLKDET